MKCLFLRIFTVASLSAILVSCQQNSKQISTNSTATDSLQASDTDCDITIGDIRFTRALNGADTLVNISNKGEVKFRAGEKKDFFCDPNGKLSNNTAPILLTEIDNTKPFTLQARIRPEFTEKGLYNAGVLYLYANDKLWQKFCFEQDERGNHRVVTVRTIGTSDDNNHDVVKGQDYVYFKYSSDTETIASYYSLNGKEWQMVRLYKNEYPDHLWVGISNQCPQDTGSISYFSELELSQNAVSDFRMGE